MRSKIALAIEIGGGVRQVHEKTGIPRGTLEKYAAESSSASLVNAVKISAAAGIDLTGITLLEIPSSKDGAPRGGGLQSLGRANRRPADLIPNADITNLDQPGMIAIPRYDEVRPSAGHGSVATSELPTTRVAFERNWLIDLGVAAESAVILPAQGDSMEPTIMNGSPMLVDTSKKEVRNGFIYVFDIDGDLVVKRIERLPDGSFDLISDNSNRYPTRTLTRETVATMTVVGRVYAAVSKF